jgi:hypothetical protein
MRKRKADDSKLDMNAIFYMRPDNVLSNYLAANG